MNFSQEARRDIARLGKTTYFGNHGPYQTTPEASARQGQYAAEMMRSSGWTAGNFAVAAAFVAAPKRARLDAHDEA
ncbi:hypothetical protein [Sorangium sp. So ce362]|uniref:hypothetical protein n=1 Tax=Sorangium sp. So ce362 TaxID=3133303 RepID=UPI003F5FBB31